MGNGQKLKLISRAQLDEILVQARTEEWTEFALIDRSVELDESTEKWPDELKVYRQVFKLDGIAQDLASQLQLAPSATSLALVGLKVGDDDAKAITTLTNLTSLNLWNNKIGTEGAKALATLTNLTSLNLSIDEIGPEGAKALATLTNLTSLDLSGNEIGPEGAKALATLTNLTSLDLSSNKIGIEGVKVILDTWSNESRSGQLSRLELRDNGDFGDLLPKEILETSDVQAILAAYRRFSSTVEKQLLNEAKLLVVGNEAVGKTSLLRYLIENKPRNPDETKTPGIVQHEKIETQGWSPENCQVQLNVWDFGGQEMMRGTHRFFLTERSLYLLVLQDRTQDDRSIHDWLKTIRNRGAESPTIVVINKSDNGKQDLRLDEKGLKDIYPSIVTFLRTACNDDDYSRASMQALRNQIVDTIMNDERLKHVRDAIPVSWFNVKNTVSNLAEQRSILPHKDFKALCSNAAETTNKIGDENEQRSLLRLLHDLGTVVAHGLDRDAPAAKREITLLDPNWLTTAVYKVLNQADSAELQGEFSRHHLEAWLDPTDYPVERHEFILDMMQDGDIGLCFKLPGTDDERYLVPDALPPSAPYYGNWPTDCLRFRFRYDFLPPGLIPRFIAKAHERLADPPTRWRTGAIFEFQDCPILVKGSSEKPQIDILVDGPENLKRSALNVIKSDLDVVHGQNLECNAEPRVPLPGQLNLDVSYEHLLKLESLYGTGYQYLPEHSDREYTVGELLTGIRGDNPSSGTQKTQPAETILKPHVVILLHGIRTMGRWQSAMATALEDEGFVAAETNYGRFNLIKFLIPGLGFRRNIINKVKGQIENIRRQYPEADFSVIAHSFGTFVFLHILLEETAWHFRRVIFCGSVLKDDFPFDKIYKRFEPPLINEIGTSDPWPATAASVTWGYGWVGSHGFRQRPLIRDRWHNGADHSQFLSKEFFSKYWLPFLLDKKMLPGDTDNPIEASRWVKLVAAVPLRYLIVAAFGVASWYGWQPLSQMLF